MNTNDNEHMRMCRDEDLLRFLDTPPGVQRPAALIAAADGATEREVCPDAHLYLRVVMGTIPAEKAADLLTHSASCDTCGQRLAAMTEVLVGNPSEEEIEGIAELALQKEWQQGLARGLAKTRSRRRLLWFSFPSASRVRLTAAALAAAVAAVSALAVWQIQRNKPEQQLARAYFEGRNLELRIPGARFAGMNPDRHTRGSADDRESSPLLEARARLAKALERDPRNAHSLALQARADILGQHYDSATETLDRLISVGPVTAELLCDDASAYYQRGLISGSEVDRSTALDYLRRADTLAPADPVVLFNEAIVMEDRGQMMNAVEVWNRYIIVERDAKWNAEGKRKLASLEQTLNRLKSHQSRLVNMLASPESLEALAKSPQTLAAWDEELSSMELDKLIPAAFPRNSQWRGVQQARGSPGLDPFCPVPCRTTRRLLRALASSLETQHQDSWLSDLLPPETQDLPDNLFARYVLAIRTLSQATRENQTGIPSTALALSSQAQNLFQTLEAANSRPSPLHTAARVGALRAALEHMFALQRMVAFRECRAFAKDFHSGALSLERLNRYPWIDGVQQLTEKVCDDTGSTRAEGSLLVTRASDLASSHHYRYLAHRARMRVFDDAQNSGDVETAESILMAVLRDLESSDSPLIRITNTFPAYADAEKDSARLYLQELIERESIGWYKATNNSFLALNMEMSLVRTEVKLGNISESERLLHLVESDTKSSTVQTVSTMLTEPRIFIAQAMLERGDVDGAQRNMEQATQCIASFSDNWALQAFAAAKGLLALDHRDYGTAASTLQLQIQTNEGDGSAFVKSKDAAAYAQLDHDLYGELAATWLAQGRSPERVLALWERFRLRSRGVPSADCPGNESGLREWKDRRGATTFGKRRFDRPDRST